ncbi:MAG: hypothetical protein AAF531_17340 [Actinomycetota bacterium]
MDALVMPAHITRGDGEAMDKPTTYEIVIRGRATERLLGPLVDDFVVDCPVPGRTRLTGIVRDPAHLHGVMAHLTSLAIEVISLTPTDPQPQLTNNQDHQPRPTTKNKERHDQ